MKKNAVMFFMKSLLKSVLVIVSVLAVGVISYKVSYEILSRQMEEGKVNVSKQEIEEILDEAKPDEISKNLIYVVDDKKNVTHMMIEICNTNTNNMDYITIPVKTDYTIPAKMYQKLCVVDEEIPQIVRLAKLRNYFSDLEDDKAYGYGELIMEKMLGTDISYYTVLSEELYESHYKEIKATTSYDKVAGSGTGDTEENDSSSDKGYDTSVTMELSVVSDTYLNQLNAMAGDREKIVDHIKAQYAEEADVFSNLTVYSKIGYVESYEKINAAYYHYWGIPGSFSGNVFVIDRDSASAFIQKLEENDTTYTEEQKFGKTSSKKTISSKGKNILVLNGSKITGLASSTQETLVNAGYTVPKVGDYTEEILTQTRIIVTKDGMGQDLAAYFKNPEIVVGTVEDGYEITIILGTVDAN
ncbi:MAG: LytR C-terminal domain-containing protein [Lachnospiraceae bacterium]|nr:LytR C-terminal domain-containing protein [Lachnospiraceae bacterium]